MARLTPLQVCCSCTHVQLQRRADTSDFNTPSHVLARTLPVPHNTPPPAHRCLCHCHQRPSQSWLLSVPPWTRCQPRVRATALRRNALSTSTACCQVRAAACRRLTWGRVDSAIAGTGTEVMHGVRWGQAARVGSSGQCCSRGLGRGSSVYTAHMRPVGANRSYACLPLAPHYVM